MAKKVKSDAQIYLEQVEKQEAVIKNKLIEKQQWKDIAMGITACMEGERVKSSGTKSKLSDAIDKCVDIEAEIDELIDKLIDLKKEVTAVIEEVQSPTEYNLLLSSSSVTSLQICNTPDVTPSPEARVNSLIILSAYE